MAIRKTDTVPTMNEAGTTLALKVQSCIKHCQHRVLWPGFVPSRLLWIGHDFSDDNSLRLVTRGEVVSTADWTHPGRGIEYTALSYCWGSAEDAETQCKTTMENISARLRNITFVELSPVIRDAVRVTRALSIKYLWVDSLCVIQGNDMDWENESALMGLVYANAHITIVTLNSSSCKQGFLTTSSRADVRSGFKATSYSSSDKLRYDWDAASWSRRGWTFQEEKLSTRLMYFGRSGIHYYCGNHKDLINFYEPSTLDLGKDIGDRCQQLIDFWEYNLVPQFSQRAFTKPQDKLPAISGLAKYIGDITSYNYVAGMWQSQLSHELLWSSQPQCNSFESLLHELDPQPSDYIAPSWSWMRFNSPHFIDFVLRRNHMREAHQSTEILVSIHRASHNAYGRTVKGELILTTRVTNISPFDMRFLPWTEHLKKSKEYLSEEYVSCIADWSLEECPRSLELALIGTYTDKETQTARYYGLLVHLSPGSDRYLRVGVFNCPVTKDYRSHFSQTEDRQIIVI